MIDFYIEVKPIIDLSVRELCKEPYYNHKSGCPNFGKRADCPPLCPTVDKVIDLNKTVYAVYNKFNIEEHINKMREKHPDWTEYQLKCVLYWQGGARKQLKNNIIEFLKQFPYLRIVKNPEASGVNLTETMKNSGIILDWPPKKYAYQIVLAGERLKRD